MIELFNIDCKIKMAEYPDKYFDLAIVDPPCGIGEDGRNNHTRRCRARSKDYSGFDFVGCEIDSTYYNDARKRLKTHQQQTTLF